VKRGYVLTIQGGGSKVGWYGVEIEEGVGAVSVVDFDVESVEAGVNVKGERGSLVLDGFVVKGGDVAVRREGNGEVLLNGSVPEGQTWVMGNA